MFFDRIEKLRKRAGFLYEAKRKKKLTVDFGEIVENFSDLCLQESDSLQQRSISSPPLRQINEAASSIPSVKEKKLVIDGYMVLEQYNSAKQYKNSTHHFHSNIITFLKENGVDEKKCDNEICFDRIEKLRKQAVKLYEAKKKKKPNLDLSEIVENFSDLCLPESSILSVNITSLGESSRTFYKPLDEVSKRQQRRRISTPLKQINEAADKNMVERNTFLGHIVEIANYHSGKDRCKSKRVSKKLKDNE